MAETIPKTDAEFKREDSSSGAKDVLREYDQENSKSQPQKSPMENPAMRTLAFVISTIAAFLIFLFMLGLLLSIFISHQNVVLD